MNENTPKKFVLQLGSLASLYLSISFLLVLLFSVINLIFPDAAESYYNVENSASGVRIGIAMLLVFFPTYLILTRMVNKERRMDTSGTYLALTKWLLYLSLLVAGGAILVDVVVLIMTFLEGDITTRFLLKILTVFIVVGFGFYYYLLDTRGYWVANEKKSKLYAAGAMLLVVASLILGFSYAETPTEAREGRLDDRQVQDLQSIQWQIEDYLRVNNALPVTLEDLKKIPTAPDTRTAYTYETTENGFRLCADFANESSDLQNSNSYPMSDGGLIVNAWNWEHPSGEYCFDRIVNMTELK